MNRFASYGVDMYPGATDFDNLKFSWRYRNFTYGVTEFCSRHWRLCSSIKMKVAVSPNIQYYFIGSEYMQEGVWK